jgi:hypothetical protein
VEHNRSREGDPREFRVLAEDPPGFANGTIEVEARVLSESQWAGFSLHFRRSADGADGYSVWVRPADRVVNVQRLSRSGTIDLIDSSFDAVQTQGSNRVTVVAEGRRIEILLNGHQVWIGEDASHETGRIALSAGLSSAVVSGESRVAFDSFRVGHSE